jgi:hypothetical protein
MSSRHCPRLSRDEMAALAADVRSRPAIRTAPELRARSLEQVDRNDYHLTDPWAKGATRRTNCPVPVIPGNAVDGAREGGGQPDGLIGVVAGRPVRAAAAAAVRQGDGSTYWLDCQFAAGGSQ